MKNFRYIIGLMLLALIALIAFQWYWIENAIAVKRDQFDRKVVESMNAAVTKIEKQEILFLANQKIKEQENLALVSLTEREKPRKKLKKVLRKKNPSPEKAAVKNLASRNKRETPENRLNPERPQNKDSLFLIHQRNVGTPSLEDFTMNFHVSDLNIEENNLLPENRMAFLKKMMREQNLIWEEFDRRSGDVLIRNQGVNQILNMIDQEFRSFINNGGAAPNNRPFNQGQNQALVESYSYSFDNVQRSLRPYKPIGDSLRLTRADGIKSEQKPIKARNVLAEVSTKKTGEKKEVVPAEEQEYEWIEVEEEVQEDLSGLEKSRNKANLVKDVFADFMQGKRDIYERLNQEMLDTLLKQELANRGIDLPYEYGVKNNGNFMFASYGLDNKPELGDLAYNVRLFPNDAIQQQQFLYVYFPNKENYLMGNMWAIFGSSIVLILMIGGIFYSSINTMLRQKKLSMIKNDFINNMTHEFKTPISTISLAVEVMKEGGAKQDPNKYLNIIKDENTRLGSQVEKVLQMALLDKGGVKLNHTKVDLHQTIEQVCQNLSVQIEKNDGHIHLELEAENCEIIADEVHMTNIFYNLIDNAAKYSKDSPEITVLTRNIDGGISVSVTDKGIGMGQAQLNKIFDKFYRVSTGNVHDVKGFGLGLAYVKKMMDLHNGTIKASSRLGEGSTFELEFYNTPQG